MLDTHVQELRIYGDASTDGGTRRMSDKQTTHCVKATG
jgi:hypothetical protein